MERSGQGRRLPDFSEQKPTKRSAKDTGNARCWSFGEQRSFVGFVPKRLNLEHLRMSILTILNSGSSLLRERSADMVA